MEDFDKTDMTRDVWATANNFSDLISHKQLIPLDNSRRNQKIGSVWTSLVPKCTVMQHLLRIYSIQPLPRGKLSVLLVLYGSCGAWYVIPQKLFQLVPSGLLNTWTKAVDSYYNRPSRGRRVIYNLIVKGRPCIACTRTLFYLSVCSFKKTSARSRAKRARENERGALFEEKIEGLWSG